LSVLTVAELNRAVAANLERSFPLLRVRGEIAQLTRASSGHLYFSLRDASASVRAVMFRGKSAGMAWQPKEGDQVEVAAVVTLYEPRGDFQLRVESMARSGQGALYEAFLARKERLAKAGLLDEARKRPLPRSIGCVGLVTSLGAAALRDVVVTLTNHAPRIQLRLYPSLVQGTDAPGMLLSQLRAADQDPGVDVILLARGGGSLEDLWAFNDEALALAISQCRRPVIVGVGHETDVTLADLVADYRAATPTAAAQRIAEPDILDRQRLSELSRAAQAAIHRRWESAQQRLDLLGQRVRSPAERMQERTQRLEKFQLGLRAAIQARAASAQAQLSRQAAQLAALDPTAILQRGYAMVLDADANVVTDAARITIGAPLSVQLSKGLLDVRVHQRHLAGDAD
jgi:exodeoxyribonuclease VII large subunit